jgi:hypothetical protein
MKATEIIRWALELADAGTMGIVEGMRHAPLTQPTPQLARGGNHPMWIMGHLAYIEGGVRGIILGERGGANPVAGWAHLFASGSEPSADASKYPPFDEVLAAYRELRAGTLRLLEEVGEEGLDRAPEAVPPGFEDAMRTVGRTFLLLALHQMVHYGQIADARRVAGLKPLM